MNKPPTPSFLSKACSYFSALEMVLGAPLKNLSPGQSRVLLLATSMFFAIGILAASWFMRDSDHQQTVTYGLIAIWWIPFSLLSGAPCRTR